MIKTVYLFDLDGFFNGTSIAQADPKSGALLMPENATETAPKNKVGYFSKWDGEKWLSVEMPKTAEDCEKIGAVSHSSQTLHDRQLRAIFQTLMQVSKTYELKRGEDLSWSVVKKPGKTPEDKKAERIAELKSLLASTDYIALKIAEGSATKKEYSEKIAQRQAWRTEINDLESEES